MSKLFIVNKAGGSKSELKIFPQNLNEQSACFWVGKYMQIHSNSEEQVSITKRGDTIRFESDKANHFLLLEL